MKTIGDEWHEDTIAAQLTIAYGTNAGLTKPEVLAAFQWFKAALSPDVLFTEQEVARRQPMCDTGDARAPITGRSQT